ncbi:basic pathogenesis-related protein 1 [Perilla frutescens var. hirtella]|uniref:Basic pathogenesis-related protein 1 n=1 Tax=Perilla frutescens var. hirtella TaxID=608512 RepID=A0AAD4JG39_PERFH|nr:basic pathogenesis-related protein 1 [Perilla frutescens var. hirtella]
MKLIHIKKPSLAILFFFIIVVTTLVGSCQGQNSPQDFLNAHNAARAQVGVGPMVWDANVARFAQNYVSSRVGDCNLVHSTNRPYGENLAKGSGDFTGKAAVDLWVSEKANYNYPSNTCAQGQVCGHYTQVVWRNSVRLGCARARCNNGWWYISCNYDPPGNFNGQRPY